MEKFKRGKGARSREALTQNISEYGSASPLRAAEIRGDNSVLLQIKEQDCFARDIKYHRSCLKNYVRRETLTKLEAQNCAIESKESGGYSKAFGKLFHYLQSEVIIKTKTLNMTDLVRKFVSRLNKEGLNICDYRSSKLKQQLKRAFGKQTFASLLIQVSPSLFTAPMSGREKSSSLWFHSQIGQIGG